MHPTRRHRPAFSLVELAMVVATIGLIGAIAVPRIATAAERSKANALTGNLAVLTRAIEMYAAEHNDLSPAEAPGGVVDTNGVQFCLRLIRPTDESGTVRADGILGPYLVDVPPNPYGGRRTVRIDGSPLASNQAGWRFDSARRVIASDYAQGPAVLDAGEGVPAEALDG